MTLAGCFHLPMPFSSGNVSLGSLQRVSSRNHPVHRTYLSTALLKQWPLSPFRPGLVDANKERQLPGAPPPHLCSPPSSHGCPSARHSLIQSFPSLGSESATNGGSGRLVYRFKLQAPQSSLRPGASLTQAPSLQLAPEPLGQNPPSVLR